MSQPAVRRIRLAYLASHPVQYQAPLLRHVSGIEWIKLTALYCSDISVYDFHDAGFGRAISWDVPLLEGYDYLFLPSLTDRGKVNILLPLNIGLLRHVRRERFDVLWVHGYARPIHILAMLIAKWRGIRVLVRDDPTGISRTRSLLRRTAKKPVIALIKRLVDGFLAVGTLNQNYWRGSGIKPDKIFMVPWAVDNAHFRRVVTQGAVLVADQHAPSTLPDDAAVILYAAKMIDRKRPGDLVDAFLRLSLEYPMEPQPHLLMVGDGEMRSALEARVPNGEVRGRVHFAGFLNQSELPCVYRRANIFVLPSVHEPWGLAINEAMNAECAIVASDQVGASADLVRDGENGFVFPAGDVEALTEALWRILRDPREMAAMGKRSARLIDSWDFDADVEGLRLALKAVLPPTKSLSVPNEHQQNR